MAINNQPTIKPRTVTGIFTRYIAKTLPLAFDESMSYYECLCALLEYINTKVIPALDNNAAGLLELQEFYEELQTYVNDYFKNLDVQEEINNKLDEMVEDGVLDQIIEQYLNSSALWGFDNVAAMKEATNLINGSFAKTLGYYVKNDGGSALYKIRTITNDDVVDDMFIIELNDDNLIAELIIIDDTINFKAIGLKSDDNTFDNSLILTSVLNNNNLAKYKFFIPSGTFYLLNSVNITRKCDGLILTGNGHPSDQSIISGTKFIYTDDEYAFVFNERVWRSTIENFDIEAPLGSGIHLKANISGTSLNQLQLQVKNIGITCEKSGYSYWNNVNITDNENSTEFIGYNFTSDNSYVTEYIYMNECTAGSYAGTYSSTYSYGVKSNHLNHFYMENCDFVGLSYGFYLNAMSNSKCINLTTSNFACNVSDLYINSNGTSVSGVYITECSFSIRSTNAHVMELERASGHYLRGLVYSNNHIADIGSGITTDYLITVASGSMQYQSCVINNNGYNITNIPFINLPSLNKTTSPLSHSFIRPHIIGLQGDEITTSYTVTLSDSSPFDIQPGILVTDSKGIISNYSVSNTKNGSLSVTLNFSSGYSGRDYISIHVLNDFVHEMTNIS